MSTNSLPPTVDPHAGRPGDFIIDPEAGIRVPAREWDAYQATRVVTATPPILSADTLAVSVPVPATGRKRSGASSETTTIQEETL